MSILRAGGMGYIGSHTAVELLKAGEEIVIVDGLSGGEDSVDRILSGQRQGCGNAFRE